MNTLLRRLLRSQTVVRGARIGALALCGAAWLAPAQVPGDETDAVAPPLPALRARAVPLVTHDPYFSIWSTADKLTDANTRHRTGKERQLTGLIGVDGKVYRSMGNAASQIQPIEQVGKQLTPMRTVYQFQSSEIALTISFLQPSLPDDLEVAFLPVTYLEWSVVCLRMSKDH
jgi:hypothetical protein